MNARTTAILAIILAILGGAYYFSEVRGGKKDPDAAKRLFAAKPEDVETLEIRTPREEIRLQRQGNAWQMEEPIQVKGDGAAVGALAASLVEAVAERRLEGLPVSLADFGLDKPGLVVRFRARGDSQWRRLEFGGTNPTGAWAYARVDEKPQVVLVADTLRGALNKTALDLRDKSVLTVDAGAVTRLVVHRGPLELDLHKEGAQWEIVKPVKARADEWRVSGLVRRVTELRAKSFAADPAKNLKPYSLDKPSVRVELWEKGAASPQTLDLAEAKDTRDLLYARRNGSMTVAEIDASLLTDLPANAWDLRDKSLFRYANTDVKRVRLVWGDKAVAVERTGEAQWKVVAPAAGAADASRVTDLLFKLTALRADGVAAEGTDRPERYGLDRPWLSVAVTKADGAEIGTLLVGAEEKDHRYVQVKGEAPVYTIPSKDLQDLPRAPEDLRQKKA